MVKWPDLSIKKNIRNNSFSHLLVSLIAVTIITSQRVHTLVATLMDLDLGTFVNVAMQRLIGFVGTIGHLIAYQMVVNALAIRTGELTGCTGTVVLLRTIHFIRIIAAIVFTIASVK